MDCQEITFILRANRVIENVDLAIRENFLTSKEHNVVEDIKRTLDLFVSKGIIDKTAH